MTAMLQARVSSGDPILVADIFFTERKTEWRSWRERRRTGLGYSGLRCSLRIRTLPVAVSLSPPVSCEAGGEKSAQRLAEDDCHPNRLHESSFQFTSPFCLISVSWKNRPEEWAILCAEGLIVSSLQSRNGILVPEFLFSHCLSQSFHPPICSWRPQPTGQKGRGRVSVYQPHVSPQVRNKSHSFCSGAVISINTVNTFLLVVFGFPSEFDVTSVSWRDHHMGDCGSVLTILLTHGTI